MAWNRHQTTLAEFAEKDLKPTKLAPTQHLPPFLLLPIPA
jgi:hypothetical protein